MNVKELLKRIEAQKETIKKLNGWAVFKYIEALIEQLDLLEKLRARRWNSDYQELQI